MSPYIIRHALWLIDQKGNPMWRAKYGLMHLDGRSKPYVSSLTNKDHRSPNGFLVENYEEIQKLGLTTLRNRKLPVGNAWKEIEYMISEDKWEKLDNLRVNRDTLGPYRPTGPVTFRT